MHDKTCWCFSVKIKGDSHRKSHSILGLYESLPNQFILNSSRANLLIKLTRLFQTLSWSCSSSLIHLFLWSSSWSISRYTPLYDCFLDIPLFWLCVHYNGGVLFFKWIKSCLLSSTNSKNHHLSHVFYQDMYIYIYIYICIYIYIIFCCLKLRKINIVINKPSNSNDSFQRGFKFRRLMFVWSLCFLSGSRSILTYGSLVPEKSFAASSEALMTFNVSTISWLL